MTPNTIAQLERVVRILTVGNAQRQLLALPPDVWYDISVEYRELMIDARARYVSGRFVEGQFPMEQLVVSLVEVAVAVWGLLLAILGILAPWTPLIAWLAFWLFAVNWDRLWPVLARGGWIGLVLIGIVATLVWGVVAPPTGGSHFLLGLTLSNFVGKFVYVTSLMVMMLLCGSAQMAGACGTWANFSEPEPAADDDHAHAAAH